MYISLGFETSIFQLPICDKPASPTARLSQNTNAHFSYSYPIMTLAHKRCVLLIEDTSRTRSSEMHARSHVNFSDTNELIQGAVVDTFNFVKSLWENR